MKLLGRLDRATSRRTWEEAVYQSRSLDLVYTVKRDRYAFFVFVRSFERANGFVSQRRGERESPACCGLGGRTGNGKQVWIYTARGVFVLRDGEGGGGREHGSTQRAIKLSSRDFTHIGKLDLVLSRLWLQTSRMRQGIFRLLRLVALFFGFGRDSHGSLRFAAKRTSN